MGFDCGFCLPGDDVCEDLLQVGEGVQLRTKHNNNIYIFDILGFFFFLDFLDGTLRVIIRATSNTY